MKKVGTITESRMTKPAESKSYPLVSDTLFGGKVKIDENASKGYPKQGVKGGTKAAAKIAKAKKVGKAKLLKDADKVLSTNQTQTAITKGGRSMSSYGSQPGNTENPGNEKVGGPYDEAKKGDNWIQGAEEDIERRGTEGKCTPITKKGCTGKAKTLAKTFKKMAKKKTVKKEAQYEAFEPGAGGAYGGSDSKAKGSDNGDRDNNSSPLKPRDKKKKKPGLNPVGNTTASK